MPATPMTVIVRVAIVAVTLALFLQSTQHGMLGHRDIAVISALATPLGISAWSFARAGHHEAAIMFLSCVLITVVTLVLVLNPLGVHDVAITAYGGTVLIASLLLSRPNFLGITVLTVAAAAIAFLLEITGRTHSELAAHSDWAQFATFLMVTAVFALIGRVASEALFGSLGAMRAAAAGDALTGLANRPGFMAQARAVMAIAPESVLLVADVDDFRRLKVMVGYAAADRVVVEAGRRLVAAAQGHLVARIGEGEFAVLAHGPRTEGAAARLAQSVHEALNFGFSGVDVRCAVGFACSPRHAGELDALMLAAEGALLRAKAADGERLAPPADRI